MSKKTTIERAYFHIHNGGITLSIVEKVDVRRGVPVPTGAASMPGAHQGVTVDMHNRSWRLRVSMGAFGSHVDYEMPLVPLMVEWALGALQRVHDRMVASQEQPTDGVEMAFRKLASAHISAENGQETDRYWPKEPAIGQIEATQPS